ncbi:MAG: Rpn family recombination-promoting nuclease/putative transposase [Oscillospiraceae bacterium]|jgi:hypothetical protein|nr:Rpn family recombination-promoting nuclease/putative transposase [Oscillospiraceae bacterium]
MDENQNERTDADELGFTPPPLADPVITAIFQDASVSGLAMKSLLNASLADSGDALISDVVTVTPQRVHTGTGERGYRIDVEAVTAAGEIVLCDVQLRPFSATNERSLLYGEQSLSGGARRGDTLTVVTANLPRVIVLNILDFVLRPSGRNFHQVAELTYREAPRERAVERFEIHHLQLPVFRELKPDFKSPLHCWLTAICRAQEQKVFLREVVEMDAALKAYCEVDPGFAQFVERHGYVASLPQVRKEYKLWQIEQVVIGEENARILAKGRAERDMEIALKFFRKAKSESDHSRIMENLRDLDIQEEIIEAAGKQAKSERAGVLREKKCSEPER